MVDLIVGDPHDPESAIEVVGVMDSQWVETWNVGPAQEPIAISGNGRWMVTINKSSDVRSLKEAIPDLLIKLDAPLMKRLNLSEPTYRGNPLATKLTDLGVLEVVRFDDDWPGEVILTMPGFGGGVPTRGDGAVAWLIEHLNSPKLADVPLKLDRSRFPFVELFLLLDPSADVDTNSYLANKSRSLPLEPPVLPSWLDAVWVVSPRGGIVWRSDQWAHVDCNLD